MTPMFPNPVDVVVAHDYLTQRGGAERVALEIARTLDAREIVTSVYEPTQTFTGYEEFDIRQSPSRMLQRFRGDMRFALPFLARAWSDMPPVDADVVVASSSGWAHGLPTTPRTLKVVYCHNPARWLYQTDDYLEGHPAPVRLGLQALAPSLRRWDHRAAATADVYVANSRCVADRIRRVYGIEAEVVHPPVSLDITGARDPLPGIEPGAFLAVSRPRGYKGIQRLIAAFARMPMRRLVVVGLTPTDDLPSNVTAVGPVSEAELRWLYANARALVSVSKEDFGLTPLEAGAFGTPALLLRAGGFLDSTQEGVSGLFVDDDDVATIVRAIADFPDDWDTDAIRANAARFSPAVFAERLSEAVARVREDGLLDARRARREEVAVTAG